MSNLEIIYWVLCTFTIKNYLKCFTTNKNEYGIVGTIELCLVFILNGVVR